MLGVEEINLFDSLLQQIVSIVGAVIAASITGIVAAILVKLKNKLNIEVTEKQEEQVKMALKESVLSVYQTFVTEAKEKAKDGKLTKEEAKQALDKAVGEAKKKLTKLSGIRNIIAEGLLKDEDSIQSKIESVIPEVKKDIAK